MFDSASNIIIIKTNLLPSENHFPTIALVIKMMAANIVHSICTVTICFASGLNCFLNSINKSGDRMFIGGKQAKGNEERFIAFIKAILILSGVSCFSDSSVSVTPRHFASVLSV